MPLPWLPYEVLPGRRDDDSRAVPLGSLLLECGQEGLPVGLAEPVMPPALKPVATSNQRTPRRIWRWGPRRHGGRRV